MKLKEGKIFRNSKKNTSNIEIIIKEYDKTKNDYYAFLKRYSDLGLKQVIITSEIMIRLIEVYMVEREFDIIKIDFMVEDDDLNNEINSYLSGVRENRAKLGYLLERLRFLTQDDSIDIKSITLQGKALNIHLARILDISHDSVGNKMNGRTEFTRLEMFKIKQEYFPDLSIDYLFETENQIE